MSDLTDGSLSDLDVNMKQRPGRPSCLVARRSGRSSLVGDPGRRKIRVRWRDSKSESRREHEPPCCG